jgi:hypothetical protein
MFSTNGVGFIDEIINFIKIIDNVVTEDFTLTI